MFVHSDIVAQGENVQLAAVGMLQDKYENWVCGFAKHLCSFDVYLVELWGLWNTYALSFAFLLKPPLSSLLITHILLCLPYCVLAPLWNNIKMCTNSRIHRSLQL